MKVIAQDIPKWLDEQFFTRVIRSSISDKDVKV